MQGADLHQNWGPSEVVNTRAFANTLGLNLDGQIRVSHNRVTDNTETGMRFDFAGATLKDNVIARNRVGVILDEARADVLHNRIVANTSAGIRYDMWQTGTVTENLIASNGVGIELSNNIFNRIEVRDNTVRRNKGAGIKGGNASSTIERNRVEGNDGTGIVSGCTPTRRNAVYGNSENGISSDCRDDADPPIEDNDVRRNAKDGILVRNNSGLVEVTGNRVRANGDDGIDVDGLAIEVDDDAAWSPDGGHVAATAGYRGQTAAAILPVPKRW